MKTRKMWVGLAMLAGILAPQFLRAQNVYININAPQLFILNGNQGILDVVVCNIDVEGLSTPANCITPLISFPTNLTILSVTKPDGTPLPATDFDNLYISNDDAESSHDVKVRIKKPLVAFGDCAEYRILVQGNAVGTGSIMGAVLFEQLLQSNNTVDDNSQSSIPVMVNLPVTLRDFSALKVEQSSVLTWHTTEETNSDRFEVQRSGNGKEWMTIQTVKSGGESSLLLAYEAIDKEPLNGENLYRLKMIDKDGSTAFSAIRSLKFEGVGMFVYPNPVVDFLHLSEDNWESVKSVTIQDVTGRDVYTSEDKPKSTIDVRSLAPGIYNVRVKSVSGFEKNHRIAVIR